MNSGSVLAGTEGCTCSTSTERMAIATGMRSVEKLKVRFENIEVLMALTELAMNSVVPSGAARAAASVPMLLLPPVRFSTVNGCPSLSVSHCAIRRAARSVVPPAAVATMMRTGRDG